MKDIIIDRINELKFYTESNIKNLANSKIPYRVDLNPIEKYSYRLDGKIYNPAVEFSKILVSQDLPYTNIPNSTSNTYILSFQDAVLQKDIYPILLFINGKFIKWSDITLVKDDFYSYLIIKNMKDVGEIYTLDIIVIPEINTIYTENVTSPKSNCIFFFDSNTDLFVSSPSSGKMYTTISLNNIPDIDIYKNTVYSDNKFNLPLDYKYEIDNLFVFNDGLIYDSSSVTAHILNTFNVSTPKSIFVSILAFAYKIGNTPKDNENTIINKNIATNRLLANQNIDFFNSISERLDFEMTNSKDIETNMSNSLRYIMDYNPQLMNQIYKTKSNISTQSYTGKELIGCMQTDGFVHLSRRRNNIIDCYFIIFKNGFLYEHYKSSIYKNNEYLFRLDNVKYTDIFEILCVSNVDNGITGIKLWSGEDDIITLSPSINIDDMILASPTPHTHLYNHERNDNIIYNVEFEAIRVSEDKVDLKLKDSYYYDKTLYIGSKHQFRYHCIYNNKSTSITEIILPDEFKMCSEKRCYMIFINGKYIDISSYDVTIYNSEDPFYNIGVYLDQEILPNDKIEVIYVGNILSKVYENIDAINNSGNILLDSSKLKYPFDNELYMIFIDGRKTILTEINNIDSNRFNIKTTSGQIVNKVSIIQFIEEDEILYSYFKDNSNLLSSIINKLTEDDIKSLYSTSNISTNYVSNDIDLKYRMMRIVKDYWMKSYINTGDEIPIHFNDYYEDGEIIDTGNLS